MFTMSNFLKLATGIKYFLIFLLVEFSCNDVFGQRIEPLSNGIGSEGIINCMIYDSSKSILYAGGQFSSIDDMPTNSILQYDGNSWAKLGNGLEYSNQIGTVNSIEIYNNELYACGRFNHSGENKLTNIAKWNGENWVNLTSKVAENSTIKKLISFKNHLIIFGNFNSIGGIPVKGIASYNSIGWSKIDKELDIYPKDIIKFQENLFVYVENTMRRFDGTKWNLIDCSSLNSNYITSISASRDSIYIRDNYSQLFTVKNDSLIQLDMPTLNGPFIFRDNKLDFELSNLLFSTTINCHLNVGNKLYLGGQFTHIDECQGVSIAYYENGQFKSFGNLINNLNANQNVIYTSAYNSTTNEWVCGGQFLFAGNQKANNIAYWSGSKWEKYGEGLNGYVSKVLVYKNETYALGNFTKSGSDLLGNLVKWDGNKWITIAKTNKSIRDIIVRNDTLLIGGYFDTVNNIKCKYFIKYDGTNLIFNNGALEELPIVNFINYNNNTFIYRNNKLSKIINDTIIDYSLPLDFGIETSIENDSLLYVLGSRLNKRTLYVFDEDTFKEINIPIPLDYLNRVPLFKIDDKINFAIGNYGWYQFDGLSWNNVYKEPNNNIFWIQSATKINDSLYYCISNKASLNINHNKFTQLNFCFAYTDVKSAIELQRDKEKICEHEYVRYNVISNDIFAKYTWMFEGSTTPELNYTFTNSLYPIAGNYKSSLIYNSKYSIDTFHFSSNLLVEECKQIIDSFKNVSFYPNPVNNYITINSGSFIVNQIEIFNILGEKVYTSQDSFSGIKSIDVSNLKIGIYLCKTNSNPSVDIFKFIKK